MPIREDISVNQLLLEFKANNNADITYSMSVSPKPKNGNFKFNDYTTYTIIDVKPTRNKNEFLLTGTIPLGNGKSDTVTQLLFGDSEVTRITQIHNRLKQPKNVNSTTNKGNTMNSITQSRIPVAKLARVFNASDVTTFYQVRIDGALYVVSSVKIKGQKFVIDATKDGNGGKKSITLDGTDLVIKNVRELEVIDVDRDRDTEVKPEIEPKTKAEVKEQVVVDADKNPDINYALVESLAKQLSVVDKQKLAIALLTDVQTSLEPAKTPAKAEPAKTPAKAETKKTEPAKAETKKTEPAKAETKKTEPAKTDSKPYETHWALLCSIAVDKKSGMTADQLADRYRLGTATINEEQNTYKWINSLDKPIAKQILNAWKNKKVTFSTINNCAKYVQKYDLESAIDCCLGKIDFKTAKANAETAKATAV